MILQDIHCVFTYKCSPHSFIWST